MLDAAAPVVVSSQLMNRQDGEDEYHVRAAALGEGRDPRQARRFEHRVLLPRLQRRHEDPATGGEVLLGYQCANSGMTLACGYQHLSQTSSPHTIETTIGADLAKTVFTRRRRAGRDDPHRQARRVPLVDGRAGRGARRPLPPHAGAGAIGRARRDRSPSSGPGSTSSGSTATSRCVATSRPSRRCAGTCSSSPRPRRARRSRASPPRASPAAGYDGHYFWDTEIYVIPFLAYTSPDVARKLLRFRWRMLPAARRRAAELSQRGALYPWRTINGEEASAYYAAGTAQYHINAAVAYALERYLNATGDVDFLIDEGAEMLVETARLWEDLGFYATERRRTRSTSTASPGPDEYTTVVNDNMYTNMMARFNLRFAAKSVEFLADWDTAVVRTSPAAHIGSSPSEIDGVAPRRRGDVHPLRRGARHPSAGRQLPRARAVGLREHPARRTIPCCCTTTRSSSTGSRC